MRIVLVYGCWWISFLSLWQATAVCAATLLPRVEISPDPIVFNPDQAWEGIDGSWNSFTLRVGTPVQTVRVFPSWKSYQTWVVAPQGCIYASDQSSCNDARGGIFDYNQSSTYEDVGIYAIDVEDDLGYVGNAQYGWDVVTLGGLGEGGPTLHNTTVGALAVYDYYLGAFGLNPKPTNWTTLENGSPSYMTQLKEQKFIPSVSFGYTAGAPYRFYGVLASLTLGGYDSSRFQQNDVEFTFASDNERDTVVAIQSITTPNQNDSDTDKVLLANPIYALVDATVPHIWLPMWACLQFEQEFGLIYDNVTDLYFVNSSMHSELLARAAEVTFNLAQGLSGGPTVQITLPYSAFDLTALPPYQGLENATRYFPLRRGHNDTQYTLGRTFMQEAYITVDYERSTFNVSQCTWVQNAGSTIVSIMPAVEGENTQYSGAGSTGGSGSTGTSGGDIAGIVVGVVGGLGVIAALVAWYMIRKRKNRRLAAVEKGNSSSSSRDSTSSNSHTVVENSAGIHVFPKAELEGSSTHPATDASKFQFRPGTPSTPTDSPTLGGCGSHMSNSTQTTAVISPMMVGDHNAFNEAGGAQVFEMPGDMPSISQADGRQITEKDMMRRREQAINGVDPHDSLESQVTTNTDPQARRTVQPEEVVLHKAVHKPGHEPNTRHERGYSRFSFEEDSEVGTSRALI
ncbi:hypothetical protein AAFC00_000911 [Neodothiora populina]|uniref:Peptidase A1 domain-containing protein n=1 Tax=Neodothiora populina TaxID=2781224 RepID=A0ABR3PMG1_9PEZI